MGADSFKSQGLQLKLGGARMAGSPPALGPQGGGVRLATQPAEQAPQHPAGAPVFSITPSAPTQPSKLTAPLGGSKIPSMKTSQAGGGARDSFTPAGNGARIRLAGMAPAPLAQEAPPQAQPEAPAPAMAGGGESVVLCEAVAEMPDGQRWVAPYEAVFPAGAKFLGVTSRATK